MKLTKNNVVFFKSRYHTYSLRNGDPYKIVTFKNNNKDYHSIIKLWKDNNGNYMFNDYDYFGRSESKYYVIAFDDDWKSFTEKKTKYFEDYTISDEIYTELKYIEDFVEEDLGIFEVYDVSKDFSDEKMLKMTKKYLTNYPAQRIMLDRCMENTSFRIKMYQKNCIYNNQLFYKDVYASGTGEPLKFSLDELKEILKCKQFDSRTFVYGGSQEQRQNAINHLLKTQDLSNEVIELVLKKYEDDIDMTMSTLGFILKSKKVTKTEDIKNIIAETIVMNPGLHELVSTLKNKVNVRELKNETVKLLLECIE